MPFTFAHPAVVLPLNYLPKRWISITGLIAGSIVPDFEYFLRLRVQSVYSHTLAGLFWFDLPLALLLTIVYHQYVKRPFINHCPPFLYRRFYPYQNFDWRMKLRKHGGTVFISIIIGAASHLLWDAFTHPHGYFVQRLPELSYRLLLFGHYLPVYKILQHSSTIIGGLVIIWAIYQLPVTGSRHHNGRRYWLYVLLGASALILIRILLDSKLKAGDLVVTCIAGLLLSVAVVSLSTPETPPGS